MSLSNSKLPFAEHIHIYIQVFILIVVLIDQSNFLQTFFQGEEKKGRSRVQYSRWHDLPGWKTRADPNPQEDSGTGRLVRDYPFLLPKPGAPDRSQRHRRLTWEAGRARDRNPRLAGCADHSPVLAWIRSWIEQVIRSVQSYTAHSHHQR